MQGRQISREIVCERGKGRGETSASRRKSGWDPGERTLDEFGWEVGYILYDPMEGLWNDEPAISSIQKRGRGVEQDGGREGRRGGRERARAY